MKVKIKKKGKGMVKFMTVFESDYFNKIGDNVVTILLGRSQEYIAHQVSNDLYCSLESSECDSYLKEEEMFAMSPSEYVRVEKSDEGFSYLTITKKNNKFRLKIYVDDELVLS